MLVQDLNCAQRLATNKQHASTTLSGYWGESEWVGVEVEVVDSPNLLHFLNHPLQHVLRRMLLVDGVQ